VHTRPRALPFLVVGAFGLLALGAVVLSVSTAPADAEQQLHVAADATLAAPGFELVDTNSVRPVAAAPAAGQAHVEVVHVRYQAPDAVEETEPDAAGQIVSVIVVGDRRFGSLGRGWRELPPSPGLGAEAVATVLFPLRAASDGVEVTRNGDVYHFVPRHLADFAGTLLGRASTQLSSLQVAATVHEDYLVGERVTAVLGGEQLRVDLVFSSVGSARPVEAPPASELVPASS